MAANISTKPNVRTNSLTAAQRVENDIRLSISEGQYPSGSLIPGRRALAEQYKVGTLTVEQAVKCLINEGLLRSEHGRGTFVSGSARLLSGAATEHRVIVHNSHSAGKQAGVRGRTMGIIAEVGQDWIESPGEGVPPLEVVRAIEQSFKSAGGATTFVNLSTAPGKRMSFVAAVELLLERSADVIVCIDIHDGPRSLAELRSLTGIDKLPIVYVSGVDNYIPCAHICYNNRDAGYKAAESLCRAGYSDITFFAPFTERWVEERIEGARTACESRSDPVSFRVYPAHREIAFYDGGSQVADAMVARFAADNGCTGGIVAPNDLLALRIMKAADDQGRVAGADYGIVGFDDCSEAVMRGLTSIRPPFAELGKRAAVAATEILVNARPNVVESLRSTIILRTTHLMNNDRG